MTTIAYADPVAQIADAVQYAREARHHSTCHCAMYRKDGAPYRYRPRSPMATRHRRTPRHHHGQTMTLEEMRDEYLLACAAMDHRLEQLNTKPSQTLPE